MHRHAAQRGRVAAPSRERQRRFAVPVAAGHEVGRRMGCFQKLLHDACMAVGGGAVQRRRAGLGVNLQQQLLPLFLLLLPLLPLLPLLLLLLRASLSGVQQRRNSVHVAVGAGQQQWRVAPPAQARGSSVFISPGGQGKGAQDQHPPNGQGFL